MLSSTKVSTTMCAMCTTRFRCVSGNPSSTYTYIFRSVRARNVASLFPWLWLPRESVYWFIDLATLFTYIALHTLHIALFFLLHVHACEPNACKFAIRIDSCPFYSNDQSVCEGIRETLFHIVLLAIRKCDPRFLYSHDEQIHKKTNVFCKDMQRIHQTSSSSKFERSLGKRPRESGTEIGHSCPMRDEMFQGMFHLVDRIPIIHFSFSELHVEFG